ncbi:uncharacterized protein LOC125763736 isoform X2 [Anopheles funestus]|nr:uncharacterized protein LOC125763736 isoform X2 [Anopheles funestus]
MSDCRECPFDPLHKIAAKKFAQHLVKCKRQHPDVKLVTCHFDTSHLVKEEMLREHMKTCSGRKDLMQYKNTVNNMPVASGFKLPDPADDLIYNSAGPSNQKGTGGISLQDDSECWDDFAYKAYDPLENCKSKLQNGKAFIIPNANRFAGQMKDAAVLKDNQAAADPDGVLVEQVAEAERASSLKNHDSIPHKERQYDRTYGCGSSNLGCIVKQEPSDYESESAGYSSSSKQYKDRDFGASSSSRRYEIQREKQYCINPEERSYRNRDRSRSDSSSGSDRKSPVYNGYFDGHAYHGSYETSRSHHHRDRYEANRNRSYRGANERHTDSDSSNRSYNYSKHKYKPYQRYM